jgi:hypothetical protein
MKQVSFLRSPVWVVYDRFMASANLQTDARDGMWCTSGSRVRVPIRMTLLKPGMVVLLPVGVRVWTAG